MTLLDTALALVDAKALNLSNSECYGLYRRHFMRALLYTDSQEILRKATQKF